MFPKAEVSDHSLTVSSWGNMTVDAYGSFGFLKSWVLHANFKDFVIYHLASNLKLLKLVLKRLHRCFSQILQIGWMKLSQLDRMQFVWMRKLSMQQGVRKLRRLMAAKEMQFQQLARDK
ncbi:hypothetical protein Droror1_Dr00012272 [Drosera rotundifolia]